MKLRRILATIALALLATPAAFSQQFGPGGGANGFAPAIPASAALIGGTLVPTTACTTPTTPLSCASTSYALFQLSGGAADVSLQIANIYGGVIAPYKSNDGTNFASSNWGASGGTPGVTNLLTSSSGVTFPARFSISGSTTPYLAIVMTTAPTQAITIAPYFSSHASIGLIHEVPPISCATPGCNVNVVNPVASYVPVIPYAGASPFSVSVVNPVASYVPTVPYAPSITSSFSVTAASGVWPASPLNVAGFNGCTLTIVNNGGGATVTVNSAADSVPTLVANTSFPQGGVIAVSPSTQYQGNVAGLTALQLSYGSNTGTLSGSITCTIGGEALSGATPAPQSTLITVANQPTTAPTDGSASHGVWTGFDGAVAAGASPIPQNITQIAGSTPAPGVSGTLPVNGPVGTGTSLGAANPFYAGCQQFTTGTNVFGGTAHDGGYVACDLGSILYIRNGSPHQANCVLTFSSASTQQCAGAATGSLYYYVADVSIAENPTQTAGTAQVVTGTGTNCNTGQTAISNPYVLPATTAYNFADHYFIPLANQTTLQELCVKVTGSTVATTVTVSWFLAY